MTKFCIHEQHAGICVKTGSYCNEGVCPYEDIRDFAEVVHGGNTMTRYADADKLLALFSFDGDTELSHLNETGRVPIPLIKDSIKTYIVKDVVQIKHGHWVNPHWKNSNYCYDCSKCKKEAMHESYEWAKQGIYPICPNCGARMSVPKE